MPEPQVTTAELAALRKSAEKATPLPWETNPYPDLRKAGVYAGGREVTIICDVTDEDVGRLTRDANAAYIVAACNLAPRLAAEVGRMRAALVQAKEFLVSLDWHSGEILRLLASIDSALEGPKP